MSADTWVEDTANALANQVTPVADWLAVCEALAAHPNRDAAIAAFRRYGGSPGAYARLVHRAVAEQDAAA